jgi:hypothetical protein
VAKMTAQEEELYKYTWAVAPYDTPEGRATAPQWIRDKVDGPASRPASGTTRPAAAKRPTTPSPGMRFLSNWSPWGIGTAILGVILVIVANVLHDHFALPNAICQSSLGQLGQAFSGTAYTDCSTAATAESAVGPLMVIGILALVVGVGKMVIALIGAAVLSSKESTSANRPARVTPRPATAARPAAAPASAPAPVAPAASAPVAGSLAPAPATGSPAPAPATGSPAPMAAGPAPATPAPAAATFAPVTAGPAMPATAAPRRFCSQCGQRSSAGDRFCAGCGAAMGGAAMNGTPMNTASPGV